MTVVAGSALLLFFSALIGAMVTQVLRALDQGTTVTAEPVRRRAGVDSLRP